MIDTDKPKPVIVILKRRRGRPPLPPGEAEKRARERLLARRLEWKSPRELRKVKADTAI